jgi:hypothetical protein
VLLQSWISFDIHVRCQNAPHFSLVARNGMPKRFASAHVVSAATSGYMLHILRAVRFEELLFSQLNRLGDLNNSESERSVPALRTKTKILLRCSGERPSAYELPQCAGTQRSANL